MQKPSVFLSTLLSKRNIKTDEDIEHFLNPSYERDLHDPFLMRDMKKTCKRIILAMESGEKIVVYADYDCDGIPGAVILSDFFKKVGYQNFEVYIPERNEEGYGLNRDSIEGFKESGCSLLLTVDLGITAREEVEIARELGIDVIITDHHLASGVIPEAFGVLNPKTDEYPEKMLSGAGVVFKLVQGLVSMLQSVDVSSKLKKPKPGWEKWMLDMAGLATLSDMVPLLGENRAIAYFGMKVLRKSPRPGLQKILQKMNIEQKHITPDDVGYMLTPKLNAASRMGSSRKAYELLVSKEQDKAGAIALYLLKMNNSRKTMVTGIMREANKNIQKRKKSREIGEVLVIGSPGWRVGVLGLVANKLCQEYERPVFVWGSDEKDCIRGSCRSDGSVSLVELMSHSKESFLQFGGHELAGGFSLSREKIHLLEVELEKSFLKLKSDKKETNRHYDMELSLSDVNMKNWKDLEKMEPFGTGNPKPIFLFRNLKVEKIKKFGKNNGEHLELTLSQEGKHQRKAVAFFSGEESFSSPLSLGLYTNLRASFDLSRFRGREELRLRIEDLF